MTVVIEGELPDKGVAGSQDKGPPGCLDSHVETFDVDVGDKSVEQGDHSRNLSSVTSQDESGMHSTCAAISLDQSLSLSPPPHTDFLL